MFSVVYLEKFSRKLQNGPVLNANDWVYYWISAQRQRKNKSYNSLLFRPNMVNFYSSNNSLHEIVSSVFPGR